jgi:hypothetical protein
MSCAYFEMVLFFFLMTFMFSLNLVKNILPVCAMYFLGHP